MVVLICMSVMVSDIEQLYFHIPVGGGWWCLVAQSCLTLFDPMDSSVPGFPVLYHLPEFAQTHIH